MKRIAALILLSALCLNLFACGQEGTDNKVTTSEAADSTTAEPEKTYDFKNADFHIVGVNGAMDNYPTDEENGEIINDTIIKRDRAVSEKTYIRPNGAVLSPTAVRLVESCISSAEIYFRSST